MKTSSEKPWTKKTCSCGVTYWTLRAAQKYHNKACAARAAGRLREGMPQTGVIKRVKSSVCGEDNRIFGFAQGQEAKGICRECWISRRYQKKKLPDPRDIVAAIRANNGSITYLELQTMFALSNKQSYELVADLVTDGYLRGLEHGRFALGDTAEPGIDL